MSQSLSVIALSVPHESKPLSAFSESPPIAEPDPFSNLNPDFYYHLIPKAERIGPEGQPMARDLLVVLSSQEDLRLGQVEDGESFMHLLPKNCDVALQALNVTLRSSVSLPGGRLEIRCKKLTIEAVSGEDPKGLVLDVSAPPLTGAELQPCKVTTAAPANQDGASGDTIADAIRNKKADPYGVALGGVAYGQSGRPGGDVVIWASSLVLNRDLHIKAEGGQGLPGVDGQRSLQRRGGNASRGGVGGPGGSIQVAYGTLKGKGALTISTEGGLPGVPGQPGEGHPTGAEAPDQDEGVSGAQWSKVNVVPEDFGLALSPLFLRKALDSYHRLYLMNPPEVTPAGVAKPSAVWAKLGEGLTWLAAMLRPFEHEKDSTTWEGRQRQAVAQKAIALFNNHSHMLAADHRPTNWVDPLPQEELVKLFEDVLEERDSLEAKMVQMVKDYTQAKKAQSAKAELVNQLADQEVKHLAMEDIIYKEFKKCSLHADETQGLFEHAKAELSRRLDHFKEAVARAYQCDVNHVIQSLVSGAGQCLFLAENPPAAAGMGVLQGVGMISDLVNRSNTTLTNDRHEEVKKDQIISDIKVVQADLEGAGKALFDPADPSRLSSGTLRLVSDLASLDKQVTKLSQAVGEDETTPTHQAIVAFRSALLEKGAADMALTQNLLRYAEESGAAKKANADKKVADAKRPADWLSPDWMDACVAIGEMYHAKVVQLMEFLVRIKRKNAFLTQSFDGETAIMTAMEPLWLREGRPLPTDARNSLVGAFNALASEVKEFVANQSAVQQPIPMDPSKRSILVAHIQDKEGTPATLLKTFRETGRITFRLVNRLTPIKKGEPPPPVPEILLENAISFFGMRVTHVHARVIGATTKASREHPDVPALLQVKVFSGWDCVQVDEHGEGHVFRHNARSTSFTHDIDTTVNDPGDGDVGAGGGGEFMEPGMDAVGALGNWTVQVSDPHEPGINEGVVVSDVSAIVLNFRCLCRVA